MGTMPEYIGHYRIISEIGRGGMGVVYKAEEESLNRFVAVKVLGEHLTQDATYVTRFQREAQAAARLNHPNIVQIYFIGEDNGRHYFAMEFVEGQSLQEILRTRDHLPADEAARLMLQAASGLGVAHAAGIIHRDIKPANLMVTKDGQLKITDFGLARPTEAATRLTATGMLMGTPAYLAPEQCLDQTIDQRADIFSLGVTFFEMLTGRRPFEANSPVALLKVIADAAPPDLTLVSPSPDNPLRRILERMLAKDPAARYQSCSQLISDLSRWLETSAPGSAAREAMIPPPLPGMPGSGITPEALEQTPTIHVDSAASQQPVPPVPPPLSPPEPQQPAPGRNHTGVWVALGIVLLIAVLATAGAVAWHAGIFQSMAALMPGHARQAAAVTQPPAENEANQSPAATPVADQVTAPDTFVDTSGIEVRSGRTRTSTPKAGHGAGTGAVSGPRVTRRQEGRSSSEIAGTGASTKALAGSAAATVPGGRPGRTGAPPAEPPAPRPTGIAVIAVGEPVIASAAEQYLTSRLREAGLRILTGRDIPALDGVLSSSQTPSTGEIIDHLSGNVAAAVIVRATYLGSRQLIYMGQTGQAYQSRLDLQCIDLISGSGLMPAWTKTVEYTRVRTDRTAAKNLANVADRLIGVLEQRSR